MFLIRKSTLEDIDDIIRIYAHAREQMKLNNNPHQWKDSEPSIDKVINDIKHGNHYILENNGHKCGVFSMIPGKDPTYSYIEGKWLNDLDYVTIHRIASDNTVKGIFDAAISYAFERFNTVRIDTHKDNTIMEHLIEKKWFYILWNYLFGKWRTQTSISENYLKIRCKAKMLDTNLILI